MSTCRVCVTEKHASEMILLDADNEISKTIKKMLDDIIPPSLVSIWFKFSYFSNSTNCYLFFFQLQYDTRSKPTNDICQDCVEQLKSAHAFKMNYGAAIVLFSNCKEENEIITIDSDSDDDW